MKKVVAHIGNPIVAALCGGLYRFANEEQAAKLLARVKRQYILSKDQLEGEGPMTVRMWVKGYAITPEEKEKGYLGNYVQLRGTPTKQGRYTFVAEKLEIDIRKHPQRKRPPQRHPDWGHPLMRGIKRKKIFDSLEGARRELLLLHEAFPEVTIPGNDHMNVIVYEKGKPGEPPVKKYFFRIKAHEEGTYYIDIKEHLPASQRKPQLTTPISQEPQVVQGQYTALVELRRKRKPPIRKGTAQPKEE